MKHLKILFHVNWLTFYVNFKCFGLKDALKMPILILGKVDIKSLAGVIKLPPNVRTGMIKIGHESVGVFPKNRTTVLNIRGTLEFKGVANIGRGSGISIGPNSKLLIGNDLTITANSSVIASGQTNIIIGDQCLLSWEVLIMSTDFHEIYDKETNKLLNIPQDIVIGNNVWMGCRAMVLKGSYIADSSIVAAGATVSGKYEESNSIYAGTPAKMIREGIFWKK